MFPMMRYDIVTLEQVRSCGLLMDTMGPFWMFKLLARVMRGGEGRVTQHGSRTSRVTGDEDIIIL